MNRIIYRQYSSIYVVFCVDLAESELGILDLIQVFVDLLEKTFENVCELDIIFNTDKVIHNFNEHLLKYESEILHIVSCKLMTSG